MAVLFIEMNVFYAENHPILLKKFGIHNLDISIKHQKFQTLIGNTGKCLSWKKTPMNRDNECIKD